MSILFKNCCVERPFELKGWSSRFGRWWADGDA